jgi:hypothetical protein
MALRAIFFLLVLGNLVFFAWGQGYFGKQEAGREPQRLTDQLQPEKLRILPPPAPAAAAVPSAAAAQAAAASPPLLACRLVRGMMLAEAETLRGTLAAIAGLTVALRPEPEPASYWVLISPMGNKAAATKKAAELKQKGITDFYIVNEEGAHQFAISLALLRTEQGAQDLLARLARKGVKSAHIEPQLKASERAQVEVRGPVNAMAKGLAGLPTTAVTECPAS